MTIQGISLQKDDSERSVSSELYSMQQSAILCNAVIHFDDDADSIFVHSCVLAASSPVLKKTFIDMADELVLEIDSFGISRKAWGYIIQYMYMSKAHVPKDDLHLLDDIVAASKQLEIKSLLRCAKQHTNSPLEIKTEPEASSNKKNNVNTNDDNTQGASELDNSGRSESDKCSPAKTRCKFQCSECNFTSTKEDDVQQHILDVHNDDDDEDQDDTEPNVDDTTIDESKTYMSDEEDHVSPMDSTNAMDISHDDDDDEENTEIDFTPKTRRRSKRRLSKRKGVEYQNETKKSSKVKQSLKKPIAPKKSKNTLQCSKCDFVATTKQKYMQHKITHKEDDTQSTDEKPTLYCCPHCDKTYLNQRGLSTHIRWHSDEDEKYKCDKAGCKFETQNKTKFKFHQAAKHEKKIRVCPVKDCYFEGKKPKELKVHLQKEHPEIPRPWQCNECPYAAEQENILLLHMASHSDKRNYVCDVCAKSFKRQNDLNRHMGIHTGFTAFTCHYCDRSFRRKIYLADHMRAHHGGEKIKCKECGLEFSTYDKFYRHRRLDHQKRPMPPLKDHICSTCGAIFKHSSHLKIHERAHRNERPFKCDICGKAFLQNGDLKKHQMIHTGEKPFLCSFCPYSTNRSFNLKLHEQVHKGGPISKPKTCPICKEKFERNAELTLHEMSVHGYVSSKSRASRFPKPKKTEKPADENLEYSFKSSDSVLKWQFHVNENVTQQQVQHTTDEIPKKEEEPQTESAEISATTSSQPEERSFVTLENASKMFDMGENRAFETIVPRSAIVTEVHPQHTRQMMTAVANQMAMKPPKNTHVVTTELPASQQLGTSTMNARHTVAVLKRAHPTSPTQHAVLPMVNLPTTSMVNLPTTSMVNLPTTSKSMESHLTHTDMSDSSVNSHLLHDVQMPGLDPSLMHAYGGPYDHLAAVPFHLHQHQKEMGYRVTLSSPLDMEIDPSMSQSFSHSHSEDLSSYKSVDLSSDHLNLT